MEYVESFDLFGTKVSQIPCILGKGEPTTATVGAVGCQYMDTDNGNMYKCIAVLDGVYTWVSGANGGGGSVEERNYEKYFDIDIAGLVSLKPEYRGLGDDRMTFSISDSNQAGTVGSKHSELPERLVIPQDIDGIDVAGFQDGAFVNNHKIKEVVLPSTVKELPDALFYDAVNLKKVEKTEQIETVGKNVFLRTSIEEIRFPSLTTLGSGAFKECCLLRSVNIGQVKAIGNSTFMSCEALTDVLGGEGMQTIGKGAFWKTSRLKSLPFLSSVVSVGEGAFFGSRCDVESLNVLSENMGANATYKQYNTGAFSSAMPANNAEFTPCKNPLNSLFCQKDTKWATHYIGPYDGTNGKEALTYGEWGCGFIVLAEIYSALMGVHFDSPKDFVPVLNEKFPDWVNYDFRKSANVVEIIKGLNFGCTHYATVANASQLKNIYSWLNKGALVFREVGNGVGGSVDAGQVGGGHFVLYYGANSDGELLVADSSPARSAIGIYENFKSASHIFTHGSTGCDAIIVRPPSAE